MLSACLHIVHMMLLRIRHGTDTSISGNERLQLVQSGQCASGGASVLACSGYGLWNTLRARGAREKKDAML